MPRAVLQALQVVSAVGGAGVMAVGCALALIKGLRGNKGEAGVGRGVTDAECGGGICYITRGCGASSLGVVWNVGCGARQACETQADVESVGLGVKHGVQTWARSVGVAWRGFCIGPSVFGFSPPSKYTQ